LIKFLDSSLVTVVSCSFSEIKFEVGFSCGHSIVLPNGHGSGYGPLILMVLRPGEDGDISVDVILIEEQISRYSCIGIEGKVVPVL